MPSRSLHKVKFKIKSVRGELLKIGMSTNHILKILIHRQNICCMMTTHLQIDKKCNKTKIASNKSK